MASSKGNLRRRRLYGILLLLLLTLAAGCGYSVFRSADAATLTPPINPERLALSCGFKEPLLALSGPATPAESAALCQSLTTYRSDITQSPDAVACLEAFLLAYPNSTYQASLELQLGQVYHTTAHFSKALASYKIAWQASRASTVPQIKALADRCLGEYALTLAYLGRYEELEPLLKESKTRAVGGSAREMLVAASEGLNKMDNDAGMAFRCGPMALSRICANNLKYGPKTQTILNAARSTRKGTSLIQVQKLSQAAGMNYQMAFRSPGSEVLAPAVTHWKVGHFAALLGKSDTRYRVEDPTYGANGEQVKISAATLDEEASGYFMVPPGSLPKGWRSVSAQEGASVWGRGDTGTNKNNTATSPDDTTTGPSDGSGDSGGDSSGGDSSSGGGGGGSAPSCGMTTWAAQLMVVGLKLIDTPVGSSPAAFSIPFTLTYSHRDALQPANFSYSNFGPKWTCQWIGIVTDNIAGAGRADLLAPGGGGNSFSFSGNSPTSTPEQMTQSIMTKVTGSVSACFVQNFPDGSSRKFGLAVGNQYFLTAVSDKHGNTSQIHFDSQMRITSITDPVGRTQTWGYELTTDPLKVTKVTDFAGRSAVLSYTADGHLESVQDTLGIVSSYTYGPGDFINTLTTPYGSTTFQYGDNTTDPSLGTTRFLTATDPAGRTKRIEYRLNAPGIADNEDAVPQGMPTYNQYLVYRNTFVWEPQQLDANLDYTKAMLYHWVHSQDLSSTERVLESVKKPLERRTWFAHPGQTSGYGPIVLGTSNQPTYIGRVQSNGRTQLTAYQYNAQGNVQSMTDPAGRNFQFGYAANGIDLISITTGGKPLFSGSYDSNHNLISATDVNGGISQFGYNSRGQLLSGTNALGQTTAFSYTDHGNLAMVKKPLNGITKMGYDGAERLSSVTDSQGYTVHAQFDDADRPTQVTFPDGTTQNIQYNLLDVVATVDRIGRTSQYQHDAIRRIVQVIDPKGGQVSLAYGSNVGPTSVVDQGGHTTGYTYDLQGRVSARTFGDGASETTTYEHCVGRVHSVTNPKGSTQTFTYNDDDTLAQLAYSGSTPSVNFTYDSFLPRVLSMQDGVGTTSYSYLPVGAPGGNHLASLTGPYGDTATFGYDSLGRAIKGNINGTAASQTFDALGRVTSSKNVLDTFQMAYLGATGQVTQMTSSLGPTTKLSYFDNQGDRRLSQIQNILKSAQGGGDDDHRSQRGEHQQNSAVQSQFDYTYDAAGQVTSKTESVASGSGHHGDDDDEHESLVIPIDPNVLKGLLALGLTLAMGLCTFGLARVPRRKGLVQVATVFLVGTSILLNGCLLTGGSLRGVKSDYSYDKLGQLIGVSIDNHATESFSYDASGNLASLKVGAQTINLQYNAANERTDGGVINSANGEQTQAASQTYEWDEANRMTAIVQGNLRSEFVYDGLGRRVRIVEKSSGTVIKDHQYFWLGSSIIQERDVLKATKPITKRYFAQGVQINGQPYYYTVDNLGSVRELVDAKGQIRAAYTYDTWGKRTKVSGDLDTDYGFAGLFHHEPSGLDLAVHRVYDSAQRRWLSRDPLGEGIDLNLFRYCGNAPTNFRDPSGMACEGSFAKALLAALARRGFAGAAADEGVGWILASQAGKNAAAGWAGGPVGEAVAATLTAAYITYTFSMASVEATAGAAADVLNVVTIQTGGNIIESGTARALNTAFGKNLTSRDWGRALEALKGDKGLSPNFHGNIQSDGNYVNDLGQSQGNISDYL